MSEIVAVVALVISVGSLALSVSTFFRDRARLQTAIRFIPGTEYYGPARAAVSVVNVGRRSVILRMWAGAAGARWLGTMLGKDEQGLRLDENERHDFELEKGDLLASTPHGDFVYEDLWIEDSLGRRYAIKGASIALKRLLNS